MVKLIGSKRLRVVLLCAGLAVAGAFGTSALISPVEAGRCICPKIYAPVVCDNGKTYPNQCVADCRNAKNCVPAGGI